VVFRYGRAKVEKGIYVCLKNIFKPEPVSAKRALGPPGQGNGTGYIYTRVIYTARRGKARGVGRGSSKK
jgi:hypothetical protein